MTNTKHTQTDTRDQKLRDLLTIRDKSVETVRCHSAKVCGSLLIDGQRHELAQVGDCSCVTREAINREQVVGKVGRVVVEIDGQQTERTIRVVDCHDKTVGFLPED